MPTDLKRSKILASSRNKGEERDHQAIAVTASCRLIGTPGSGLFSSINRWPMSSNWTLVIMGLA
jgi:hypothetical protein